MNWNDPAARARLSAQLGPTAYNEAQKAHIQASTVASVNGHAIRPVQSRFGRLFMVGSTRRAFRTFAEAKEFAAKT